MSSHRGGKAAACPNPFVNGLFCFLEVVAVLERNVGRPKSHVHSVGPDSAHWPPPLKPGKKQASAGREGRRRRHWETRRAGEKSVRIRTRVFFASSGKGGKRTVKDGLLLKSCAGENVFNLLPLPTPGRIFRIEWCAIGHCIKKKLHQPSKLV